MFAWMMWMAGGPATGQTQQGNPLTMLLFFVAIFVIFYLLIIRPQQKRAREHRDMLENVRTGDRVLTAGGLIGNVVGTKDADGIQVVVLKVSEDTKVEVARANIQQVLVKQR
jgi:preprotein translocase subunit YajC